MALTAQKPMLFHRRILEAAVLYGDDIALTDCETGENCTFLELRAKSVQLAAVLHQRFGIGPGQILLAILPNCMEYPVLLLASALLGAQLCGVAPDSMEEELSLYLSKTSSRAIFAESGARLDWLAERAAQNAIPLVVLGKLAGQPGFDYFELLSKEKMEEREIREFLAKSPDNGLGLDATFAAIMSSGVSGVPKVVLQTHRNYNAATDILKHAIFDELTTMGGGRRATIAGQPFHHTTSLWILCYCLLSGHRSLIMPKFAPIEYLKLVERYKIDTLSLSTWHISLLLKHDLGSFDLSSVRTIIVGGSSDATNSVKNAEFLKHFPGVKDFLIGYGMTEVVLLSHMTPLHMDQADARRLHSVGKLLPGFEYKLLDCQTGTELSNDQTNTRGELLLRSDCLMAGYLGEPERTREAIDADGWFHTGDCVSKDADGFFFVVDRISEMLLVQGQPVWPAEIEAILLTHPQVLEACVIGTNRENGREQVPMAFVVLSCEKTDIVLKEIGEFANARLNAQQQLKGGIHAIQNLPKTSFGKVAKQKVRAMAKEMGFECDNRKEVDEEFKFKQNMKNAQNEEEIVTLCTKEEAQKEVRFLDVPTEEFGKNERNQGREHEEDMELLLKSADAIVREALEEEVEDTVL